MSKHIGSTLESLFDETGERAELELMTRKKALADEIRHRMAEAHLTQVKLAKAMNTSRTVVHRLLDPSDTGVTFETLANVANALGMELTISLTPRAKARKVARSAPPRRAKPPRRQGAPRARQSA